MFQSLFLKLDELYQQNKFLDAYQISKDLWSHQDAFKEFSVQELLLFSRLAKQLGSPMIERRLLKMARDKDPESPAIWVYSRGINRLNRNMCDALIDIESRPHLNSGDPNLDASWSVIKAVVFTYLRDFDQAHGAMAEALAIQPNDPWIMATAAFILLCEDKIEAARVKMEEACLRHPHNRHSARIMSLVLSRLGRWHEAWERIAPLADKHNQSYEITLMAIGHGSLIVEREEGAARDTILRKISDLSSSLESLAPLADKKQIRNFNAVRAEIYRRSGDYDHFIHYARQIRSAYYKIIVENVEKMGNLTRRIIPCRPIFQNHNTCLPASIATALSAFNIDIDPEAMAQKFTYKGTSLWPIRDWCRDQGLIFRCFTLDFASAAFLIEQGIPLIMLRSYGIEGHAVVVIGIDYAQNTLILHDPSCPARQYLLLDTIKPLEEPFGPVGVLIVPIALQEKIAGHSFPEEMEQTALYDFDKAYQLREKERWQEIFHALQQIAPEHPITLKIEAILANDQGEKRRAFQLLKSLLEKYPHSLQTQQNFIDGSYGLGNTGFVRKILASFVKGRRIPGHEESPTRIYPAPRYISYYADILKDTKEGAAEAEKYLKRVLRFESFHAEAFYALGNISFLRHNWKESAIMARAACTLNTYNEFFSITYAQILRLNKREQDGLAWLQKRVNTLGTHDAGGQTWITLISMFFDFGYPDEAMATLETALHNRPNDGKIALLALKIFMASGQIERAQNLLAQIQAHGNMADYFSARFCLADYTGERKEVLAAATQWMEEEPGNMEARRAFLRVYAECHGYEEASMLAQKWLVEQPEDEHYETLLMEILQLAQQTRAYIELLKKRLERNPFDAASWRMLGHHLVDEFLKLPLEERDAAWLEIQSVFAECQRTAPEHVLTIALQAGILLQQNDIIGAMTAYRETLRRDPEYRYALDQIFHCNLILPPEARWNFVAVVEDVLQRSTRHFSGMENIVSMLITSSGVQSTVAILTKWLEIFPNDPELIKSYANCLLQCGVGFADYEKVSATLEAAIARFPNHIGLRMVLAHAYDLLRRFPAQAQQYREVIRRSPQNYQAQQSLAYTLCRLGKVEEAMFILRSTLNLAPLNHENWAMLALICWQHQYQEEALNTLALGVKKCPAESNLWVHWIAYLVHLGRHDEALAAAKAWVSNCHDNSEAFVFLAKVFERKSGWWYRRKADNYFRKAMTLNPASYLAVEEYAEFLGKHAKFTEASRLLEDYMKIVHNPLLPSVKLAMIWRQAGRHQESREKMHNILETRPDCQDGWLLLLEWCYEDSIIDGIDLLLARIPENIMNHPMIAARCIQLLALANIMKSPTNSQWALLFSDVSKYLAAYVKCLESLLSGEQNASSRQKDFLVAENIVTGISQKYQNIPQLLVFQMNIHIHHKAYDQSIEMARQIWESEEEEQTWPEFYAWKILDTANLGERAEEVLLGSLKVGKKLRRKAIEYYISYLKKVGYASSFVTLLNILEQAPWNTMELMVYVLLQLAEMQEFEPIEQWQKAHESLCQNQTPFWQLIGRTRYLQGEFAAVMTWMADWRDRDGVEMWSVSNYTAACREAGNLKEWQQSSLDALKKLPFDHTTSIHAVELCHASLFLDDDECFLTSFKKYGEFIRANDSTRDHYKVMAAFYQLLDAKDRQAAHRAAKQYKIALKNRLSLERFYCSAWEKRYVTWAPLWRHYWKVQRRLSDLLHSKFMVNHKTDICESVGGSV